MIIKIEVAKTYTDPLSGNICTVIDNYHLDSKLAPIDNNIISIIKDFNKSHNFRLNPVISEYDNIIPYISRVHYEHNTELLTNYIDYPFDQRRFKIKGIYPIDMGENFKLADEDYPFEQILRMSNKIIFNKDYIS